MAVNTRNKRMALVSLARPFRPTLPEPTGAMDTAGERMQLAYRYPVEAVSAPATGRKIWRGAFFRSSA